MKCKICGTELKRPGEICNNCMNKILLEQEAINDTGEIYTAKRKFAVGYEILSHLDSIGVAIFLIAILISLGKEYLKLGLIAIPFFLVWGILYLLYKRYKIKFSEISFYKTKLVYTYRKIRKKQLTISYRDIKEINYEIPRIAKAFNLGNLIIKNNSKNLLKRILIIENVENIEEVFEEIQKNLK